MHNREHCDEAENKTKPKDEKTTLTKTAADKKSDVRAEPAAKASKSTPAQANVNTQKKVAGADKNIGKDDKGRTIYEGPRGGRYYINSNGNKSYIKKDA